MGRGQYRYARRARESSEIYWMLALVGLLLATLLLIRWSAAADAALGVGQAPATSTQPEGQPLMILAAPAELRPEPTPPFAALESELYLQAVAQRAPVGLKPARQLRVGLQVGHWRMAERPEELAWMEPSTAAYGDVGEQELNLVVARETRRLLERQGIAVDLLGVTVPPGYRADAFVAIHADAAETEDAHGWKLSPPWRASPAAHELLGAMTRDYAAATGLAESAGPVTDNMRGYYAFNYHRFTHAIAPTTPAIIVELGFMSSPSDRAVLFAHPERAATGLAGGIMRFLDRIARRDDGDYQPFFMPEEQTIARTPLYAGPEPEAKLLTYLEPGQVLVPYAMAGERYLIAVRDDWHTVGWVSQYGHHSLSSSIPLILPTPTRGPAPTHHPAPRQARRRTRHERGLRLNTRTSNVER